MTYYRKDYSHIEKMTGLVFKSGDTVRHRTTGSVGTVMMPGRNRDMVYVRFNKRYAEGYSPQKIEVIQ